ncbi:MAG: hypothetical protein IJH42_04210, partial [Atopobiaceae bacterium]|nr:hypothetical protein [Atopobiaceae bacterium]
DNIDNKLDQNKNSNEHADGSVTDLGGMGAESGASLSTNILKTQDVKTEEKAPSSEATTTVTNNTNKTANPETASEASGAGEGNQSSKKVMVAAAIGANITNHKAIAQLVGTFTAAGFDVDATNQANYRTYATGAAATGEGATASIGAAVAVGVNNNQTIATLGIVENNPAVVRPVVHPANITSAGDVNVRSTYTQNMDGVFAGLLGAQTIAGAASGSGSTATVAGAVSVLVSNSKTCATVVEGSTIDAVGNVTVKAYDKSKLAVRAGALMASGGSTVGVGASFALVYGNNVVRANVGDGCIVQANDLAVNAEKVMVTFSDYAIGKDWSDLYTIKPSVKKGTQPDPRVTEAKDQSLITLTEEYDPATGKKKYTVKLNVDTDTVLGAIDLLNFLSSTNYYVEAIAGAVQTGGDSTFNAAGSFAFVFANNAIEALIGDGCTIDLARDLKVEAVSGSNVRMIAGAFSVSSAKVGAGASVTVFADKGTTTAAVGTNDNTGDATTVDASGSVFVSAHGSQPDPEFNGSYKETSDTEVKNGKTYYVRTGAGIGGDPYVYTKVANPTGNPAASGYYEIEEGSYETSNVMVISVAPGITTSGNAGVGLVVPIIVMENTYKAEVADNVSVEANGDVIVTAQNDAKLLPISLSVGAGEQVGVGGTVQALVQKTETIARVGKAAKLIAANGLARVAASSTEFMVNVLASAAASTKVSVAAVINACITRSVTNAIVDEGAYVKVNKDVSVTADSESFMVAVSVSLAGSSQTAAGAVVNVFVFDRDVHALVAKGVRLISETGDVLVDAKAKDYTVIVTVGGAASGNAALSGTIPVIVSTNRIGAIIGTYRDVQGSDDQILDAAGTELRAAGSIGVLADYDTRQYVAAGGFAGG